MMVDARKPAHPPRPEVLTRLAGRVVGAAAVAGVVLAVVLSLVAGVLVGVIVGLLGAVGVGAGLWYGRVRSRAEGATDRVVALVGTTRPADAQADARYLNLVEGLAPGAGLTRPRCLVAEGPSLNAIAVGSDPKQGAIVVTAGLLDRLDRMELEGVVAWCLVQLRDGRTVDPTLSQAFSPHRAAGPAGPHTADDLGAVALTRYPPGLGAALRRIEAGRAGGTPDVPAGAAASLGGLWLVPPGEAAGLATRIETLAEL
jgi:Zn-dependent protease with chaperone function